LTYTNHLVQTAYAGGAAEAAAAILPCCWGYCEIGQMLASRGAPSSQPLYARWIEMYDSPEFAELADWLRSFIDRTALESGPQELAQMETAFIRSSQLEYMFWDAAYRLEKWPV
jgi:thiaminase/transcriptional activator TenA